MNKHTHATTTTVTAHSRRQQLQSTNARVPGHPSLFRPGYYYLKRTRPACAFAWSRATRWARECEQSLLPLLSSELFCAHSLAESRPPAKQVHTRQTPIHMYASTHPHGRVYACARAQGTHARTHTHTVRARTHTHTHTHTHINTPNHERLLSNRLTATQRCRHAQVEAAHSLLSMPGQHLLNSALMCCAALDYHRHMHPVPIVAFNYTPNS